MERIMPRIAVPKSQIAEFCRRNGIRRLALFGSALRPDFSTGSDIDILVEFQPGRAVGFFELYDMEEQLSRIFGGRKVDLNTPGCLSKYFRDEVLSQAEVEYAEA
jgi:predicted nucleotidyltransferase